MWESIISLMARHPDTYDLYVWGNCNGIVYIRIFFAIATRYTPNKKHRKKESTRKTKEVSKGREGTEVKLRTNDLFLLEITWGGDPFTHKEPKKRKNEHEIKLR
jgi:hypothetical protein